MIISIRIIILSPSETTTWVAVLCSISIWTIQKQPGSETESVAGPVGFLRTERKKTLKVSGSSIFMVENAPFLV